MPSKIIDRFDAVTDSGKVYALVITQEYEYVTNILDEKEIREGFKHITTSSGGDVNYIDDNTYKIVSTDEIAKRIIKSL